MSGCKVEPWGTMEWRIHGKLHREDGPAAAFAEEWWLHGEPHREGGPELVLPDGREEWWVNGMLYREGGPANVGPYGYREWYLHGEEVPPPGEGATE